MDEHINIKCLGNIHVFQLLANKLPAKIILRQRHSDFKFIFQLLVWLYAEFPLMLWQPCLPNMEVLWRDVGIVQDDNLDVAWVRCNSKPKLTEYN